MVTVRVPASSANMGSGFDTLGVGVGLYNTVSAEEIPSGLDIRSVNAADYIPKDEKNLIYRAMMEVFDEVGYEPSGLRIVQKSDIPVTRGLGSSSACIIGGMLAANVISGRRLKYDEILNVALRLEGHPDNLAPALYGGFCVSMMNDGKAITKSIKINSDIKFAAMIPNFFVPTNKSRRVLPDTIGYRDAVFNISHATMFATLFASGNLDNLHLAVQDKMHQQYRSVYIDDMEGIFEQSYKLGAKAVYLSGSGPTIMAVLNDNYSQFQMGMQKYFKEKNKQCTCKILSVDNVGAIVKTNNNKFGKNNFRYK